MFHSLNYKVRSIMWYMIPHWENYRNPMARVCCFICQECLSVIAQSQLLSSGALNHANNTELVRSQTPGEIWEWSGRREMNSVEYIVIFLEDMPRSPNLYCWSNRFQTFSKCTFHIKWKYKSDNSKKCYWGKNIYIGLCVCIFLLYMNLTGDSCWNAVCIY